MTSTDLRFGLVGYGLWGRHHARAVAKTPGAALVAIADFSETSRAQAEADHPGVTTYANWRAMLARDDLDVIDVAVPNYAHYEVAKAALEAGRHVFVEKPMVLAVEQADELIALAKAGQVLAVDHEMRLSRLWGKVKELIDAGTVGTPQYVLLELSRFPYRLGSDGWRYDIRRVGNWILEEPIHFFDLARWYFQGYGEPVLVYARANARRPEHPELQDNFTTIVDFSHGGFAVVTQTLAAFEHHVTCKISGTRGAIWAHWSGADARTSEPTFGLKYSQGEEVVEVKFPEATGEVVELQQQIAALVQSIRLGVRPPADGEDGRMAVCLCLAAQRSVDEHRPISIPQR